MSRITTRPGRRGRRIVVAAALVLLLVVAAWAADRVLHARTEERVAGQLAGSLDLAEEPRIAVEGFPFLTQVAAGELDSVRAEVDAVVLDETAGVDGLMLREVSGHARGVTVQAPSVVDRLELTGTLPDASVEALVQREHPGVSVRTDTDGLRLSTELMGIDLALRAEPAVTDAGVVVRVVEAELGGATVERSTLAAVVPDGLLETEIDVGELPLGLRLVGVEPVDGGLRLRLTGEDVTLEE
ncbi:DUF2993 domain-containing protein [Georgenia halophila]|uniref:DUF2993 domain-containing protein n=1 Tax=Georgenia halophila TaxID=620889 RepID=A0ABP8LFL2_9MICO